MPNTNPHKKNHFESRLVFKEPCACLLHRLVGTVEGQNIGGGEGGATVIYSTTYIRGPGGAHCALNGVLCGHFAGNQDVAVK